MLDCSGFKKEHIHGVAEQIHLTRGHRVGREAYIIHRGLISSQVVKNYNPVRVAHTARGPCTGSMGLQSTHREEEPNRNT